MIQTGWLTLLVAGYSVVVLALLTGIGLLARRSLVRVLGVEDDAPPTGERLLVSIWLGFVAVLVFVQIWHFFGPIGLAAFSISALVAVAGLGLEGRWLLPWFRESVGDRRGQAVFLLVALVTLWLANLAIAPCCSYDTAMYHLPTMRWAQTYAVVPGIANLHSHLAFNGSSLLYAAWVDAIPGPVPAWHATHGPLLLTLLIASIVSGLRLWFGEGDRLDMLRLGSLMVLVLLGLTDGMSSLNTDFAVALLMIMGSWQLARALDRGAHGDSVVQRAVAALLLIAAVTVKLSAVGFVAVGVAWAMFARGDRSATSPGLLRLRLVVVAFAVLMGGTWTTRGLIQSGYPAFPGSLLGAPVDWRASADHADGVVAWIHLGSRNYRMSKPEVDVRGSLDVSDWLGPWLAHTLLRPRAIDRGRQGTPWSVLIPLLLGLAGGVFAMRRRRDERCTSWEIGLGLTCAAGLAFWFFNAPAPRHAWGPFGLVAALGILALRSPGNTTVPRPAVATLVALGLSPLWGSVLLAPLDETGLAYKFRELALNRAPSEGGFPALRDEPRRARTLSGGLVLETPTGEENACWDSGLLCTPQPEPRLRLREPGNLGAGFFIDGPWQAERWPHPGAPMFREAWLQHIEQRREQR